MGEDDYTNKIDLFKVLVTDVDDTLSQMDDDALSDILDAMDKLPAKKENEDISDLTVAAIASSWTHADLNILTSPAAENTFLKAARSNVTTYDPNNIGAAVVSASNIIHTATSGSPNMGRILPPPPPKPQVATIRPMPLMVSGSLGTAWKPTNSEGGTIIPIDSVSVINAKGEHEIMAREHWTDLIDYLNHRSVDSTKKLTVHHFSTKKLTVHHLECMKADNVGSFPNNSDAIILDTISIKSMVDLSGTTRDISTNIHSCYDHETFCYNKFLTSDDELDLEREIDDEFLNLLRFSIIKYPNRNTSHNTMYRRFHIYMAYTGKVFFDYTTLMQYLKAVGIPNNMKAEDTYCLWEYICSDAAGAFGFHAMTRYHNSKTMVEHYTSDIIALNGRS